MRQFAPETYCALKTAWKDVVAHLGGLEATASTTRVARSQVAAYGDVHSDRFVPVDVVLDAERVAGVPSVTQMLARAHGLECVAQGEVPREGLPSLVARIGRDASSVFADVAHALAGRPLSAAERARLLLDLTDLRLAAAGALAVLDEGRS